MAKSPRGKAISKYNAEKWLFPLGGYNGGIALEKKKTVRISQCMIVKNEESNIEKALSWGKEIMWEQIVVDTGSTDRTAELAAGLGASVYHFPWNDDFAAAKNFAVGKAQGDWIAFLDADEVLAQGDEQKLHPILNQLEETEAEGVTAAWLQIDDEGKVTAGGTQIRIFKNRAGLGYRRRIHEQLVRLDGTPMRVADGTAELSILHSGYSGKARKKKDTNRNLKLIQMELAENPDDHEMLGYLGDECYAAGDLAGAENSYRTSISHMPAVLDERDQRSAATFLYLLQIMEQNSCGRSQMQAVYAKAVSLLPKEADFDYLMGMALCGRRDYAGGAACLEKALSKLERFGSYNRAMMLMGHLRETYETLARCFFETGERERAVKSCIAVLQSEPYSMQALVLLLRGFHESANHSAVTAGDTVEFLKKLYDLESLKDRLFLLKASAGAEWRELESLIERLFTTEELARIRNVWREER